VNHASGSLIERGIVGLAEPELFKITEPAAWAENSVLDTIERIVEARRRAADPDGCEGPVLLPFTRRIPARSKARASKRRHAVGACQVHGQTSGKEPRSYTQSAQEEACGTCRRR
jgi:hypothetical protein